MLLNVLLELDVAGHLLLAVRVMVPFAHLFEHDREPGAKKPHRIERELIVKLFLLARAKARVAGLRL